MSDTATISTGWGDPFGPTSYLRSLHPQARPAWLVAPWRFDDGDQQTFVVEPDHLDARDLHDLVVLAAKGFAVRVEPTPAGYQPGLIIQLRREITDDRTVHPGYR